MRVFSSPSAVVEAVGTVFEPTEWLTVTQERVAAFAEATDDRQWIHLDTARAADGPFGGTIAHGFLTLSLLTRFLNESYRVEGTAMGINYGLDRARFLQPVLVGSRIRGRATIAAAEQVPSGLRVVTSITVDIESADRPALVADFIVLYPASA